MQPVRTVRQLRIRAPDEALARRGRLLLEDALRTASLPIEGAALLLVRRLELPPFRGTATPQSVALALEARCRALTILSVTSSTTEDDIAAAVAVRFQDPLQARSELAGRVLRGPAPDAWCWPLAVPGYYAGLDVGEALRVIAMSMIALPEAEAAVPLWLDALVSGGSVARLVNALSEDDADCLLAAMPAGARRRASAAGVAKTGVDRPRGDLTPVAAMGLDAKHSPAWRDCLAWAGRRFDTSDRRRLLLEVCAQSVLCAGMATTPEQVPGATRHDTGGRMPAMSRTGAETHRKVRDQPNTAMDRPATPRQDAAPLAPGNQVESATERAVRGASQGPSDTIKGSGADEATAEVETETAGGLPAGSVPDAVAQRSTASSDGTAAAQATSAAGLLFLLRVLESLGLPEWLDGDLAWAGASLPARILGCALRRLRVPEDDPAWMLADFDPARPLPAISARQWSSLAEAGASRTPRCDGETVWLNACRRWLRTRVRIGMADLVCRPGFLALTATHADVWMALERADLRIRRAGLDIDPGWVPWLGRVVHFHYGDAPS